MIRECDKARRTKGGNSGICGQMAGPSKPVCGRRGFTLAELLIAIGILGVGLTMSAALFPAGLAANKNSADDLLGTLICQNGLALAKMTLRSGDLTVPGSFVDLSSRFQPADLQYPAGGTSSMGFLVIGRKVQANKNDHQVMVIAYRKHPGGGSVTLRDVTGTAIPKGTVGQFTFSTGSQYVQVGSPLFFKSQTTVGYATILSKDGSVATIDVPMGPARNIEAIVIHQEDVEISPIIGMVGVRTALQHRIIPP